MRQLDLADRSGARAFAESLLADGTPVDVLVNSAGILMPPPKRTLTADGSEPQFGTSVLGLFALTALPLPRILQSATPRVATKSSLMANFRRIRFDDLQRPERCKWREAHAQSKLAAMLTGMRLAELAAEAGSPCSRPSPARIHPRQPEGPDGNPGRDASQPGQPGKRPPR